MTEISGRMQREENATIQGNDGVQPLLDAMNIIDTSNGSDWQKINNI